MLKAQSEQKVIDRFIQKRTHIQCVGNRNRQTNGRIIKRWHHSTIEISLQFSSLDCTQKIRCFWVKKYRMVIDYRKLNEDTIADRYPIPNIGTILSNLGSNKYFSTIDLKSGFHQIAPNETDMEKTAFSIANGKFKLPACYLG